MKKKNKKKHLDVDARSIIDESVAVFIFMQATPGKPTYVSDVREWLAAVDAAGVPNHTEIEGTLHMSYDIRQAKVERIECLQCGTHDVLVAEDEHNCS
jgi:hypothetical protein